MGYLTMFRRDDGDNCGSGGGDTTRFGVRIASVFVILVGSMFGAFFPVLARRSRWLSPLVPKGVFDFAKYFGSGVIVSIGALYIFCNNCDPIRLFLDCYRVYPPARPCAR